MEFTQLTLIVSFILAISLASERLVEILKGIVGLQWPSINAKTTDDVKEAGRKAWNCVLSIAAGMITAFLTRLAMPDADLMKEPISIVTYGLLASGGSSFWNSILAYLLSVKDIKKNMAAQGLNNLQLQATQKTAQSPS
jgi:hypothetical protein